MRWSWASGYTRTDVRCCSHLRYGPLYMTEAISRRTSRPPLTVMVFVVGAASLGSEIAAARLLAPYFGASTTIWANTIAVVLLALSTGYWYGGRLADRHAERRHLSALVLAAAF